MNGDRDDFQKRVAPLGGRLTSRAASLDDRPPSAYQQTGIDEPERVNLSDQVTRLLDQVLTHAANSYDQARLVSDRLLGATPETRVADGPGVPDAPGLLERLERRLQLLDNIILSTQDQTQRALRELP